MEVEGIGPEVAASVYRFFGDKKNKESIDRLKKAGVKVITRTVGKMKKLVIATPFTDEVNERNAAWYRQAGFEV
jgi:NAD-dependent DNA ligase